ncbi:hypothetical protein [Absidia glauca]|uniref:Uncharacterized protein n=1 Tax=Absidia glauca TaxID=4829 RepID=A0A168PS68_ABSGL|nr:hypothetical protein [Absidia glauca]
MLSEKRKSQSNQQEECTTKHKSIRPPIYNTAASQWLQEARIDLEFFQTPPKAHGDDTRPRRRGSGRRSASPEDVSIPIETITDLTVDEVELLGRDAQKDAYTVNGFADAATKADSTKISAMGIRKVAENDDITYRIDDTIISQLYNYNFEGDFDGDLDGEASGSKQLCIHTYDKMDGFCTRTLMSRVTFSQAISFLVMYEMVYLNPNSGDQRLRLAETCSQSICFLIVSIQHNILQAITPMRIGLWENWHCSNGINCDELSDAKKVDVLGTEESYLISNIDLVVFLQTAQTKIRLVVQDFAGLTTNTVDLTAFFNKHRMLKEVLVDLGHTITVLSRQELLSGKVSDFDCRKGCLQRSKLD